MGFVLGYGAHCFELYGIRTWIVAFWTFVAAKSSGASLLTPIVVSVVFTLLAMPASILGNECALRFGRHRAISAVMFASAAVALLIGFFADQSPWLLLPLILIYAITVPADSGALTSGMSMSADPSHRGATMAVHSTVGFSLSALARGRWVSRWTLPEGRRVPRPGWLHFRCWRRESCSDRWRFTGQDERRRREPQPAIHHHRHSAPRRRWPGHRATICRRSSPIRSRAISASPRTGSLPRSPHRWSFLPCSARGSAARSIWSAAGRCCRCRTWCWRPGWRCSASPLDPDADRRLAPARRRHGRRSLRCRLCRARAHLRRCGAPLDHRHHADGGVCLDHRMAAVRMGPRDHRLAQHLLRLGGGAYPDRTADQSHHAAGGEGREGGGGRGRQAAHPDRSHHDPAGVRLRGGLDRHRRDGGAPAAHDGGRRRDDDAGGVRRRPDRAVAGGRPHLRGELFSAAIIRWYRPSSPASRTRSAPRSSALPAAAPPASSRSSTAPATAS